MARRGYRFIAPVQWNDAKTAAQTAVRPAAGVKSLESPSNQRTFSHRVVDLLRRCLRKGQKERMHDMGDGRIEIEETKPKAAAPAVGVLRRWNAKSWIAVAALLAALIVSLWRYLSRQKVEVTREPLRLVPSTTLPGLEYNPAFSPDGKLVAFQWNGPSRDNFDIYVKQAGRAEQPFRLTTDPAWDCCPAWSPDGGEIAFVRLSGEAKSIYTVPSLGGTERKLYEINAPTYASYSSWSHDGRWIYFSSNRSGTFQIWKMPSEGGKASQVTKGGGFYAVESFDGKMLYYDKPGHQSHDTGPIWKVPCEGGNETPVVEREVNYELWVLRPEGIYFATYNGKRYTIEFFIFQTGKVALFYEEETPNARDFLMISPDGQWFLYNDQPLPESDLMLVENFR
jgi:WD40 repeat protein